MSASLKQSKDLTPSGVSYTLEHLALRRSLNRRQRQEDPSQGAQGGFAGLQSCRSVTQSIRTSATSPECLGKSSLVVQFVDSHFVESYYVRMMVPQLPASPVLLTPAPFPCDPDLLYSPLLKVLSQRPSSSKVKTFSSRFMILPARYPYPPWLRIMTSGT